MGATFWNKDKNAHSDSSQFSIWLVILIAWFDQEKLAVQKQQQINTKWYFWQQAWLACSSFLLSETSYKDDWR